MSYPDVDSAGSRPLPKTPNRHQAAIGNDTIAELSRRLVCCALSL
jgi:hypothetical protein